MRPCRLELEGFASFRERAVVDFQDTELVAFTGPTGAGKSSLIDAIIFALYGTIPRYDDRRLVAPVITQGEKEARVRFDFLVGDDLFTAVRVVRRTATGATTREARLEQGSRTLASTAEQLTNRVEELLGLNFEHFVRCVVLPQGEFARFLHSKPGERQELLVQLLELGHYQALAKLASARHRARTGEARQLRRALESAFGEVDPLRAEELRKHEAVLARLRDEILRVQPLLEELAGEQESLDVAISETTNQRIRLQRIRIPGSVASLDSDTRELDSQSQLLLEQRREAQARAMALREQLDEGPSADTLAHQIQAWARHDSLLALRSDQQDSARELQSASETARKVVEETTAQTKEAEERLAQARLIHAGSELARQLRPGDPCPVCGTAIDQEVGAPTHEDLSKATLNAESARQELTVARARVSSIEKALAAAQARTEQLEQEFSALQENLSTAGSHDACTAELKVVRARNQAYRELEQRRNALDKASEDVSGRMESLRSAQTDSWRDLSNLQRDLEELAPPKPSGNLLESWQQLADWGVSRLEKVERDLDQAVTRKDLVAGERRRIWDRVVTAGETAAIELDPVHPLSSVERGLVETQIRLEEHETQTARLKTLEEQIRNLSKEADLAGTLSDLLGARRFRAWLLGRVLRHLAEIASGLLLRLSGGQYSLGLDGASNFVVVDHFQADEERLARTLSGGETFLASLALALALSEHVIQFAARGRARLDSIFLDEGFGSLDNDTLDTVASALEELGSDGRLVCVVTHIEELAARIPSRLAVAKDSQSSRVEQIEAA